MSFHHDQVSFNGTTRIEGELDLADALDLDLDTALARGAESLKAGGSTESLDIRRAMAAGELARDQLAHVDAYEVPERLQEQTNLRDVTCVFPWCTRAAGRTDSEHCISHAQGGTT